MKPIKCTESLKLRRRPSWSGAPSPRRRPWAPLGTVLEQLVLFSFSIKNIIKKWSKFHFHKNQWSTASLPHFPSRPFVRSTGVSQHRCCQVKISEGIVIESFKNSIYFVNYLICYILRAYSNLTILRLTT